MRGWCRLGMKGLFWQPYLLWLKSVNVVKETYRGGVCCMDNNDFWDFVVMSTTFSHKQNDRKIGNVVENTTVFRT